MASTLLPDELWDEIAGLFPPQEYSPEGGRHPKEHRVVLTTILFVLKTGIGWEDLPTEAFDCSYKTCKRRIEEWSELGLWQRIHECSWPSCGGPINSTGLASWSIAVW